MIVHWKEVLELAIDILNMEDDAKYSEVDNKLYDRYDITLDDLETCVKLLIGRTPAIKTPLGLERMQGFLSKNGKDFIIGMEE